MPNWEHVLREIQKEPGGPNGESGADRVRLRYLTQLYEHTGRNIICYYSGWLSKPKIEGIAINDEDKNGFMLCTHKLDRKKGLDLFLHTPGGNGASTASIVDYLQRMFGRDMRTIIPQIAMSAGTIIACASREIIMGKHSNIGPVDPQINGIPAHAVLAELDRAYDEMKADPKKQYIWHPILSRYTPSFVQQCQWAVENGKEFVAQFLANNMFADLPEPTKTNTVNAIVERLTDLSKNKGHDRHIHIDECKEMGLKIHELEDPEDRKLQDLVLTVHHCFMYTLSNTGAFKIVENHVGKRMVKISQEMVVIPGPPPAPINPPAVN